MAMMFFYTHLISLPTNQREHRAGSQLKIFCVSPPPPPVFLGLMAFTFREGSAAYVWVCANTVQPQLFTDCSSFYGLILRPMARSTLVEWDRSRWGKDPTANP